MHKIYCNIGIFSQMPTGEKCGPSHPHPKAIVVEEDTASTEGTLGTILHASFPRGAIRKQQTHRIGHTTHERRRHRFRTLHRPLRRAIGARRHPPPANSRRFRALHLRISDREQGRRAELQSRRTFAFDG